MSIPVNQPTHTFYHGDGELSSALKLVGVAVTPIMRINLRAVQSIGSPEYIKPVYRGFLDDINKESAYMILPVTAYFH